MESLIAGFLTSLIIVLLFIHGALREMLHIMEKWDEQEDKDRANDSMERTEPDR